MGTKVSFEQLSEPIKVENKRERARTDSLEIEPIAESQVEIVKTEMDVGTGVYPVKRQQKIITKAWDYNQYSQYDFV